MSHAASVRFDWNWRRDEIPQLLLRAQVMSLRGFPVLTADNPSDAIFMVATLRTCSVAPEYRIIFSSGRITFRERNPEKLDQARLVFERMLGYANHLGLYAEQTGLQGEALGNFPQAFTHLALISATFNLDRILSSH